MTEKSNYRVLLNKRWSLEDLYKFPHAYIQTYAFAYCFQSSLPSRDLERIEEALRSYPWQGGYSYVNIYSVLQSQVPREYRPQIKSIQYASPGWIELVLHLDPAIKVASSVAAISASIATITAAYASVQRSLHQISKRRKEARVDKIKADRHEAKELRLLSTELAKKMGFSKLDNLIAHTGNVETAAKLLAAQYRRLKILSKYVANGRLTLPVQTFPDQYLMDTPPIYVSYEKDTRKKQTMLKIENRKKKTLKKNKTP